MTANTKTSRPSRHWLLLLFPASAHATGIMMPDLGIPAWLLWAFGIVFTVLMLFLTLAVLKFMWRQTRTAAQGEHPQLNQLKRTKQKALSTPGRRRLLFYGLPYLLAIAVVAYLQHDHSGRIDWRIFHESAMVYLIAFLPLLFLIKFLLKIRTESHNG